MDENNLSLIYLLPVCVLIIMPLNVISQDASILALALTGVVGVFYYLFVRKGTWRILKAALVSIVSFIIWWPLAFFSVRGTTLFFEFFLS